MKQFCLAAAPFTVWKASLLWLCLVYLEKQEKFSGYKTNIGGFLVSVVGCNFLPGANTWS